VTFIDSLVMALKSLAANKLRSILTMLGIIIGVGAVITLMSVGRGAQAAVTSTFQEMGTDIVYVIPSSQGVSGLAALGSAAPSLTLEDAEALTNTDRAPSVLAVAPESTNYGEVIAGNESLITMISGVTPDYQLVLNYTLASGQFLSNRNVAYRDTVVVLGSKVAEDLFGDDNPVGQNIKIQDRRFTVIGVLEPKGGAFMGVSRDDVVLTPITTYQARLFTQKTSSGEDAVQSITVKVNGAGAIDSAIEEITTILRNRHRIINSDDDDFAIISQDEIVGMLNQVTGIFTIFLGAIAGISLLVGGIGIMNIMLVSVTERTKEIGIRKAVGAKRRNILLQFLTEAAILSLAGGGIGIAGGVVVSYIVSQINLGGQMIPAVVSPDIVILAISVSIFIGLTSGIYPAIRASRMNPIECLHYG